MWLCIGPLIHCLIGRWRVCHCMWLWMGPLIQCLIWSWRVCQDGGWGICFYICWDFADLSSVLLLVASLGIGVACVIELTWCVYGVGLLNLSVWCGDPCCLCVWCLPGLLECCASAGWCTAVSARWSATLSAVIGPSLVVPALSVIIYVGISSA